MKNNTTTNINTSALMDCIITNKGFASKRINAEQISAEALNEWHGLLDTLLKSAYAVVSDAHNGNNADHTAIYVAIKPIFDLFGTLENGGKLRADSDTALVMMAFASVEKNVYSSDYKYKCSQIALEKTQLAERSTESGEPKRGMEASFKTISERIEKLEAERDALKLVSGSIEKATARQKATVFYKKVEDLKLQCEV